MTVRNGDNVDDKQTHRAVDTLSMNFRFCGCRVLDARVPVQIVLYNVRQFFFSVSGMN